MFVCGYLLWYSLCVSECRHPQRSEEGTHHRQLQLTGYHELRDWHPNSNPLEEQHLLLTSGPPLQSPNHRPDSFCVFLIFFSSVMCPSQQMVLECFQYCTKCCVYLQSYYLSPPHPHPTISKQPLIDFFLHSFLLNIVQWVSHAAAGPLCERCFTYCNGLKFIYALVGIKTLLLYCHEQILFNQSMWAFALYLVQWMQWCLLMHIFLCGQRFMSLQCVYTFGQNCWVIWLLYSFKFLRQSHDFTSQQHHIWDLLSPHFSTSSLHSLMCFFVCSCHKGHQQSSL